MTPLKNISAASGVTDLKRLSPSGAKYPKALLKVTGRYDFERQAPFSVVVMVTVRNGVAWITGAIFLTIEDETAPTVG